MAWRRLDDLPMRTLIHGDAPHRGGSTLTNQPRLLVVRNIDEWADRWSEVTNALWPPPPLPAVDWGTEQVLLLTLGRRPTGGYQATIETVGVVDGVLRITACESRPRGAALDSITYPVHAVAVQIHGVSDEIHLVRRICTSK